MVRIDFALEEAMPYVGLLNSFEQRCSAPRDRIRCAIKSMASYYDFVGISSSTKRRRRRFILLFQHWKRHRYDFIICRRNISWLRNCYVFDLHGDKQN